MDYKFKYLEYLFKNKFTIMKDEFKIDNVLLLCINNKFKNINKLKSKLLVLCIHKNYTFNNLPLNLRILYYENSITCNLPPNILILNCQCNYNNKYESNYPRSLQFFTLSYNHFKYINIFKELIINNNINHDIKKLFNNAGIFYIINIITS